MTEPLPPNQFDSIEDGQVVRTAAQKVQRYTSLSNKIEVILVALAALALVILSVQTARNSDRVRLVGEQNNRFLRSQVEGAQFAINAVNCLRYIMVEHRYVNEEYHREQALRLGIEPPHHSDLGQRPTKEQIEVACKAFESNPTPPQVNTPTTRKGK